MFRPQNDFTGLLSHFLNINASVAERFVPMAKSSAFLDRLNDNLVKALMAKRNEENSKRSRRLNNIFIHFLIFHVT
jgi:hypothetical protein